MIDQPLQLQPFSLPPALSSLLPGFSAGIAVTWILYAAFAFWTVYTLIAIYHWLRYSHTSWVAFPAIGAHLLVSLALASYALSGHAAFLDGYLP